MVINKSKCTGCGCCKNVCPKGAIAMKFDEEGFQYPIIDHKKCINCNLCQKNCPQLQESNNNLPINVYAVKNKDNKIRKISSSGGIFSELFLNFISNGGIVYGVIFNDDYEAVHIRCTKKSDLPKLRGSKYVQSNLKEVFSEIIMDLENNKTVLFVGTPCQIAGLKSNLSFKKISLNNLYTCDIICHGVPSPGIFGKYIAWMRKIYGEFDNYCFRDKDVSWHGSNISIVLNNKKIINTRLLKTYSDIYFGGFITRPSCHSCKYTSKRRISDITIGDFWGIEKICSSFADDLGVSLCFINTIKGKKIFDKISNNINYMECNIEECNQPQLVYPSSPNRNRNKFWKDYTKNGIEFALKKWSYYRFTRRFLAKTKNCILILMKKLKREKNK